MTAAQAALSSFRFRDIYQSELLWSRTRYQISPHTQRYGRQWLKRTLGWYIGPDSLFPMGDNRDNSRDARYFNAVRLEKVLGRANIRFWPLNRLGPIK